MGARFGRNAARNSIMKKRQITMQDGRYLIFYTFEEQAESEAGEHDHDEAGTQRQPDAKPEAEEERSV